MAGKVKGGLTAAFVAKSMTPGKYYDSHGLFIQIFPSSAKCWQQRLTIRGRRRTLGLGGFPVVSLAMAREAALDNKRIVHAGGDPLALKRQVAVPTFAEAAAVVLEHHRPTWTNAKHADDWIASLERYAMPRIGVRPVSDIEARDVLNVLLPIWHTRAETARRVRQRIGAVMLWAMAQGHRADNPAGEAIAGALPKNGNSKTHRRALPYAEVAGAVTVVCQSEALPATKLLFQFLVLTAGRSLEVRGADWSEIDFSESTWTLPASRMKARHAHRVPLSDRALEVLAEARELGDGRGLVFPGTRRGRPLSDMTISKLLRELGIPAVPHGFRSSFRDWAAERTSFPSDVVEAALAHRNPNKVESAYKRTDLFVLRRKLMQAWASYLALENLELAAVVSLDAHREAAR